MIGVVSEGRRGIVGYSVAAELDHHILFSVAAGATGHQRSPQRVVLHIVVFRLVGIGSSSRDGYAVVISSTPKRSPWTVCLTRKILWI